MHIFSDLGFILSFLILTCSVRRKEIMLCSDISKSEQVSVESSAQPIAAVCKNTGLENLVWVWLYKSSSELCSNSRITKRRLMSFCFSENTSFPLQKQMLDAISWILSFQRHEPWSKRFILDFSWGNRETKNNILKDGDVYGKTPGLLWCCRKK